MFIVLRARHSPKVRRHPQNRGSPAWNGPWTVPCPADFPSREGTAHSKQVSLADAGAYLGSEPAVKLGLSHSDRPADPDQTGPSAGARGRVGDTTGVAGDEAFR